MSSYWGYITLKDSVWLPWYLGGLNPEGSIANGLFALYPQTPPGTQCYILFTFGYHVFDFTKHLLNCRSTANDWREMMLHHIAAIALYPGFILSNIMGVGVLGAWLHDLADIFVTFTRLMNCFDFKWPTLVGFVGLLLSWFYTRILFLPIFIYTCFVSPSV